MRQRNLFNSKTMLIIIIMMIIMIRILIIIITINNNKNNNNNNNNNNNSINKSYEFSNLINNKMIIKNKTKKIKNK